MIEQMTREEMLMFEELCIAGQYKRPRHPAEMLQFYFHAVHQDLRELMEHLFKNSRPSDPGYPNDLIQLNAESSVGFDAFVAPIGHESPAVRITVSSGVLLALDDLFYRLSAHQAFFNSRPFTGQKELWPGGDCLWPLLGVHRTRGTHHELMAPSPTVRYFDYQPLPLDTPSQASLQAGATSYLSSFFSAVPKEEHRRLIAHNMVGIAMKWILLHEESHFAEGHLAFQERIGAGVPYVEKLGKKTQQTALAMRRKVMEWQADRSATEGSFDLIWKNLESLEFQSFPPGIRAGEKNEFCLRFLMTSIGTVSLLFRYVEILRDVHQGYPKPQTRLAAMFFAVAKAFVQRRDSIGVELNFRDLLRAISGTLDDLMIVSRVLGLESKSGLGAVPTQFVQDWENFSELGLFDDPDEGTLVCCLLWEKTGAPQDLLGAFEISPNVAMVAKCEAKWFHELKGIVQAFNQSYYLRFSSERPF